MLSLIKYFPFILLFVKPECYVSAFDRNTKIELSAFKHVLNTTDLTDPSEVDLNMFGLIKGRNVNLNDQKIINGFLAESNQFPYQVALFIFGRLGDVTCGGSVITRKFILTAAHCVLNQPTRIVTISGTSNLQKLDNNVVRMDAKNFYVHQNFNGQTLRNDICLIELTSELRLSHAIWPIKLPSYAETNRNYLNEIAVVSGFGKTIDGGPVSNQLMYARLNVMDQGECRFVFNDRGVESTNICTSGSTGNGACQGDSGGPMVVNDILVGVVSFGSKRCSLGHPTVYTRVNKYLEWIAHNSDVIIV